MFNRQTLFILGAGASVEVGLPVGTGLAETIGKKMDIRFEFNNKHVGQGDIDLFYQLTHQMQRYSQEYQAAGWRIRDGIVLAQSIDDFLDQHRNDPLINHYGKAAVVKSILEAERQSKLYCADLQTFRPDNFTDSWFVKFMQMLSRGVAKENVCDIFGRVSFIVFNYDRCLEHFLLNALQKAYGITLDEAKATLSGLRIFHPYGAIDQTIPFGAGRSDYVKLAEGIKTYTEQIGDADVVAQMAADVRQAECIVFLGFAYHSQNMRLLRPNNPLPRLPVFGTARGMSDADVEVVDIQIEGWLAGDKLVPKASRYPRIKLENGLTCAALFDYYAKSLTGGD
jgi:hypothetical protein